MWEGSPDHKSQEPYQYKVRDAVLYCTMVRYSHDGVSAGATDLQSGTVQTNWCHQSIATSTLWPLTIFSFLTVMVKTPSFKFALIVQCTCTGICIICQSKQSFKLPKLAFLKPFVPACTRVRFLLPTDCQDALRCDVNLQSHQKFRLKDSIACINSDEVLLAS